MLRWAYLPYPPLVSVDKVYSLDTDGNETDITGYYVDEASTPATVGIHRDFGGGSVAQVRIEYTCGYGGGICFRRSVSHSAGNIATRSLYVRAQGRLWCGAGSETSGATGTYGMYRVGVDMIPVKRSRSQVQVLCGGLLMRCLDIGPGEKAIITYEGERWESLQHPDSGRYQQGISNMISLSFHGL